MQSNKRSYNSIDLTNKKFGKLFVIESLGLKTVVARRTKKSRKEVKWKCICECGKIVECLSNNLRKGLTKACGSCRGKAWNNKTFGKISGIFWSHIKINAKRRNIEFNLTIEDSWNLFIKQSGKCSLSNLPIEFGEYLKDIRKYSNSTASLDRIDSLKGYTIDNVQWVHKDINLMKNIFSQNKFIDLCTKIADYNKGIIGKEELISF